MDGFFDYLGYFPPLWARNLLNFLPLIFAALSIPPFISAMFNRSGENRLRVFLGTGVLLIAFLAAGFQAYYFVVFRIISPTGILLASPDQNRRIYMTKFSLMFAGNMTVFTNTSQSGTFWQKKILDMPFLDDDRPTSIKWSPRGDRFGIYYTSFVPQNKVYLSRGFDFKSEKEILPTAAEWQELLQDLSASGSVEIDLDSFWISKSN